MEFILKNIGSALMVYSTHYGVTKLYNYACVPDGLLGYLRGLVTVGSPVCEAGVKIITNTQVSYSTMILMGITRSIVDMIIPGAKVE
jgi:hypothetical protein